MRVHWLSLMLAVPLVFAGCGDDDDDSTATGGAGGATAGKGGMSGTSGGKTGSGGSSNGGSTEPPSAGASGDLGGEAGMPGSGGMTSVTMGGTTSESGGTTSTTGGTINATGGAGPLATGGAPEAGAGPSGGGEAGQGTVISNEELNAAIDTVVVIYAENRSFDGLFGDFPGAHGLSEVVDADGNPTDAYIPQKDRDGSVLPKLPQTWGGVTAPGNLTVVTQAQSDNLPNAPFSVETGFLANGGAALTATDVTRDLAHRFFENQMEINGGTNDMFAAWVDAGGLTMGHFSYAQSALYHLAKQYVLADNFFEGAFGGSFLNHHYLICACAPVAPTDYVERGTNPPSVNVLGEPNAKGVPQLLTVTTPTPSPASALTGAPLLVTGNIAPENYFGAGDGYRAVNTMQPPYQPSGNPPVADATGDALLYADTATKTTTLPPQTQTTIGDELNDKSVTWAWYATSWDAATTDGRQPSTAARTVIYTPANTPRGNPYFQAHHHPFNYYSAFDPVTNAAARAEHLKDYTALLADISAGTLPSVVFYKPTGYVNQHPGYANIQDGDAHIADLVSKLKAGAQWQKMLIVITYDEYGGQWDHVAPPKGDLIGPGTRVPAIIISPHAKKGFVDHTPYDTASILRLITRRHALPVLPGLTKRDQALVANGAKPMGDLTNALDL